MLQNSCQLFWFFHFTQLTSSKIFVVVFIHFHNIMSLWISQIWIIFILFSPYTKQKLLTCNCTCALVLLYACTKIVHSKPSNTVSGHYNTANIFCWILWTSTNALKLNKFMCSTFKKDKIHKFKIFKISPHNSIHL